MLFVIQIISFLIGFLYGLWAIEYWMENIKNPNFDLPIVQFIISILLVSILAIIVSPIHWLIVKVRPRFIQWCRNYNQ